MTRDDILASLFPNGSDIEIAGAILSGKATLPDARPIHVLGITQGQNLGVDEAIVLAGHVIEIIKSGDTSPILVLVDSASQRMSRRDELLGLSGGCGTPHCRPALRRQRGRSVHCHRAGHRHASGASRRASRRDGSAVDGAGHQASDRGPEGQGGSDAGIRARARQHGPHRRHSRCLGRRCAFGAAACGRAGTAYRTG